MVTPLFKMAEFSFFCNTVFWRFRFLHGLFFKIHSFCTNQLILKIKQDNQNYLFIVNPYAVCNTSTSTHTNRNHKQNVA